MSDTSQHPKQDDVLWQSKLLPWMVLLPTVLIGVFILLATIRMRHFESFVFQQQRPLFENTLPAPNDTTLSTNADLHYRRLYVLSRMEEYSMNKRYSQAGILTLSTIYTKYMGFFTGMILAIVGSVFIIGKLREDASKAQGEFKDIVKFRFVSASPGIIFGLLGTVLMSISIINKGEVQVDDMPLYLNANNFINMQDTLNRRINATAVAGLPGPEKNRKISPAQAAAVNP